MSKHTAPKTGLSGKKKTEIHEHFLCGYTVKEVQENWSTPEEGTDKLSRNVGT